MAYGNIAPALGQRTKPRRAVSGAGTDVSEQAKAGRQNVEMQRHRKLMDRLYDATRENPMLKNDPDKKVDLIDYLGQIFSEESEDGALITEDEFKGLLEYYGVDEDDIEDSPLKALIGGKFPLTEDRLIRCLQIFNKIGALKGYTLGYFLSLEEVYVVGGKELAPALRAMVNKMGKDKFLSGDNKEMPNIWDAARAAANGNEKSDIFYQWLGTLSLMAFIKHYQKAGKISDIEDCFDNSLSRQLLQEHVRKWTVTNKGISDESMELLEWRLEGIEELKDNNIPIQGINLFKHGNGKIDQESLKLLDEAIEWINGEKKLVDGVEQDNVTMARKTMGKLMNRSDQAVQRPRLGSAVPAGAPK